MANNSSLRTLYKLTHNSMACNNPSMPPKLHATMFKKESYRLLNKFSMPLLHQQNLFIWSKSHPAI